VSEDITKRLAAISEMMMEGQPFNDGDFTDIDAAIFEIERLRTELARYRRMYCRSVCRDYYAARARWKIRDNPMRADGVFVVEDCEDGKARTFHAFPCQFDRDDAKEIVDLLNRATDELYVADNRENVESDREDEVGF
jgi:hypothetical protein